LNVDVLKLWRITKTVFLESTYLRLDYPFPVLFCGEEYVLFETSLEILLEW